MYIGNGSPNDTLRVCDLVMHNECWYYHRLSNFLPEYIVKTVTSMIPPFVSVGSNRLSWKWMSKDTFSSVVTYYNPYHPVCSEDTSSWNLIWKAKAPKKLHVFLWTFW